MSSREEPEYIEESEEILMLKKYYTADTLQVQKGHLSMAYTLLTQSLYLLYSHTRFSHLVNKAGIHQTSIDFSKAMGNVSKVNNWSYSSTNCAFNTLVKLLQKTNIDSAFIQKISMPFEKKIKRDSIEACLPTEYKKRDSHDPERQTLVSLLTETKETTRYKSTQSLRVVISFVIAFLNHLGISYTSRESLVQGVKELTFPYIIEGLKSVYPKKPMKTKLHYGMVFICQVLQDITYLKDFELEKKRTHAPKTTRTDYDAHRLSRPELEKMYEATNDDIAQRSIFLLMISTGMRTIGVSNLKLENLSTTVNDTITINKTGRTLEKGKKWFTFPISDKLAEVIREYVLTKRKSNSSYLFPGKGEDIGMSPASISATIKRIARKAGVSGKHVHAHSLRHSFAHILLESGNDPELVSKMLGHTSTSTTEYYYLKESAAEASKRMNIPWLERQEQPSPVPNFLENKQKKPRPPKPSKKERNKILMDLAKDFRS